MRKNLALLSLALLSAVALPAVAKADNIQNFNLSGNLQNGSVSGIVTIDTTTGTITGANFSAVITLPIVGKQTYVFDSGPYLQGDALVTPFDYTAEFKGSGISTFQLGFPTTSLINYAGGNICAVRGDCNFSVSSLGPVPDLVTSGSLAPTPEPSSLLLLSTGILGLAGAARRRFTSAA